MAEAALVLAGVLAVLTAARVGLAAAALRRGPVVRGPVVRRPGGAPGAAGTGRAAAAAAGQGPSGGAAPVTVLVAVRSGDPLMPAMLRENVASIGRTPHARLVLLVDEDDAPGRDAAAQALAVAPDLVTVVPCAPPEPGRNPKVVKLVVGLERADALVAVLDDDTVLPDGALGVARDALAAGHLVTGLPVYREQGSLWSRLVAAFVNGSALVTYLPLARVAPPVTVNGMFVLTRRDLLEGLGGFAAISGEVCDDYALARLYRGAGLTLVQTTVTHPLATTVPGPRAYARILRRWMVFSQEVLRRDLTPAMVALVVLPAVLPLLALALAVASGRPAVVAAVVAVLASKVLAVAALRRRVPGAPRGALGVVLELVADLLTPVHAVGALVGPRRVAWRDRQIRTGPAGPVMAGDAP